ncbi:hypothetical protein ZIOFF_049938 [Zingiber officinale]|uniref:Uncharacterized protein n=1 Tax=Zingiber officinale TaxID=94328 RepID=A0A8J5KQ80_ZINOF|nr:hypothetical protein ZIOFF_049938 [Zingiber officinale]
MRHEFGKYVAAELGPGATFVPCDVNQEPQVAAVVDLAVAKHGRLDIMYNNADICGPMTFAVTYVDLTEFDRVMAVNVWSVVLGIKHAVRVMVPRRAGSILYTTSITGLVSRLAPLTYSPSKAAVAAAVRLSAAELSNHGIRVNCISPVGLSTLRDQSDQRNLPGHGRAAGGGDDRAVLGGVGREEVRGGRRGEGGDVLGFG